LILFWCEGVDGGVEGVFNAIFVYVDKDVGGDVKGIFEVEFKAFDKIAFEVIFVYAGGDVIDDVEDALDAIFAYIGENVGCAFNAIFAYVDKDIGGDVDGVFDVGFNNANFVEIVSILVIIDKNYLDKDLIKIFLTIFFV